MTPPETQWTTIGLDPAPDNIREALAAYRIRVVEGGDKIDPGWVLADPEAAALLLRELAEARSESAALRVRLAGKCDSAYTLQKDSARLADRVRKSRAHLVKAEARLADSLAALYRSGRWKLANLFRSSAKLSGIEKAGESLEKSLQALGAAPAPPTYPTVDVVVCVHNALGDVRVCLGSVAEKTPKMASLIIVNDGSDAETSRYLEHFAAAQPFRVKLIHNSEATGYTRAANQGLRAAASDYVVLLNSDTIVPHGWLERLVRCGESREKIGIVGPLSNAASWQSVPGLHDENGDWLVNDLPPGMSVDGVQKRLAMAVPVPGYPGVPLVNGFCFAVKRAVLRKVGYLDEGSFPRGYGEENDLCIRTTAAGFELAIADDTYIFHAKSKSYSHERRRELSRVSGETLAKKHGTKVIAAACDVLAKDPSLGAARAAFARDVVGEPRFSVLFLLGATNGGGGSHSVVQETAGLRELGCYASVAVEAGALDGACAAYPEFPADLFFPYSDEGDLVVAARGFEAVVATHFGSVDLLEKIVETHPGVLPAYYIQDYEPLFFAAGSAGRVRAERSYTQVPGMVRFAKTQWICDQVGGEVHRVEPGLDTEMFNVDGREENGGDVCRVAAMIRPETPRRAPLRTYEVLAELAKEFGDKIQVQLFGCKDDDPFWESVGTGFKHGRLGILDRKEMAALLRDSDVFLDLSDYQAFGRTGLEAMACGCVPLLPAAGGAASFATGSTGALTVDTTDREAVLSACRELVGGGWKDLRVRARETASRYSIARAAGSELALLAGEHARRFPSGV